MPILEGQVALVTGGSRGIGQAICRELAAAGASVAVNYREGREAAEAVAAGIVAADQQKAGGAVGRETASPCFQLRGIQSGIAGRNCGPVDWLRTNYSGADGEEEREPGDVPQLQAALDVQVADPDGGDPDDQHRQAVAADPQRQERDRDVSLFADPLKIVQCG